MSPALGGEFLTSGVPGKSVRPGILSFAEVQEASFLHGGVSMQSHQNENPSIGWAREYFSRATIEKACEKQQRPSAAKKFFNISQLAHRDYFPQVSRSNEL